MMIPLLGLLLLTLPLDGTPVRPVTGSAAMVADTFLDAAARSVVERGRARRGETDDGLESFEGQLREHLYVGLDALRFRRERGLFQQERTGRFRWTREGDRIMRWEGADRAVPIVGRSASDSEGLRSALVKDLREGRLPPPLLHDPGGDRLFFGSNQWALDPLADTAGLHYRFRSGDTLRISLPQLDESVNLVEVRVEPRRSDFRLVVASLWFDVATGSLVRAVYRPSRPFDLELDAPEDAAEVPRFLRPIRAEIRAVTVDHSLHEFGWWIPRRFAFEGEARVAGLARFPLSIQWTVGNVEVNEPPSAALQPDSLPEGWTVVTRTAGGPDEEHASDTADVEEPGDHEPPATPEGDARRQTHIFLPPPETLADGLPGGRMATGRPGLDREELRRLEGEVRDLVPSPDGLGLQLAWGLQEGLTRFNRVEGLATGVAGEVPLPGDRRLRGEVRSGVSAPIPTGELRLLSGRGLQSTELAAFHRLVPSSEWSDPLTPGASLSHLILGEGPTPYHRTAGVEVGWSPWDPRNPVTARLFLEHHRSATVGTHFHLRNLWQDRPRAPIPPSLEGWFLGAEGEGRWEWGLDPERPRAFGRLHTEGAVGAADYFRVRGSMAAALPIGKGWDAATEIAAGWGSSTLPPQRRFSPGSPLGFRGDRTGEVEGRAFWMARGELGRGFTGARAVLFTDLLQMDPLLPGEAPPRRVAIGAGGSFLDGLFRVEAARRIRPSPGGSWRVLFYLDALF